MYGNFLGRITMITDFGDNILFVIIFCFIIMLVESQLGPTL